jgi:hypothetical protein
MFIDNPKELVHAILYGDCQKKRFDWGSFFAAITYAAILL